jgi:hypothetical protein
MKSHFDPWSVVVILLTLILFAVALVLKGFTHDLLLETGVFLVSAKLVLMSYKNSVASAEMRKQLNDVLEIVRQLRTKNDA